MPKFNELSIRVRNDLGRIKILDKKDVFTRAKF